MGGQGGGGERGTAVSKSSGHEQIPQYAREYARLAVALENTALNTRFVLEASARVCVRFESERGAGCSSRTTRACVVLAKRRRGHSAIFWEDGRTAGLALELERASERTN